MPNIEEQNDLEMFLNWEPDRPAALYMARVLGDVYGLELEEERNGAGAEVAEDGHKIASDGCNHIIGDSGGQTISVTAVGCIKDVAR